MRKYITQGYTPAEICAMLNITSDDYQNYIKRLAKQEKRIMESDNRARDAMFVDLATLKDRLTGTVKRCTAITENQEASLGIRLEAEKILCEASLAIVKLSFEGPAILRQLPKHTRGLALGKEMLPQLKTADEVERPRESLAEDKAKDSEQGAEDSGVSRTN